MATKNNINQINAGILNDYSEKPRNLIESKEDTALDFYLPPFNKWESGGCGSFIVNKIPEFLK
jgi:hypothetical protein